MANNAVACVSWGASRPLKIYGGDRYSALSVNRWDLNAGNANNNPSDQIPERRASTPKPCCIVAGMAAYTSEQHKDAREFVEWIGKAVSPDGEASDHRDREGDRHLPVEHQSLRSGLTVPTIGIIRRMCEALDLPVLIGFVKAGLLSEDEAAVEIHSTPIASFLDLRLACRTAETRLSRILSLPTEPTSITLVGSFAFLISCATAA
ncbi:hypothetical protein GS415_10385 [Rhodococcus hoagii]|nr:hypothetical protein [Prescottella equi]